MAEKIPKSNRQFRWGQLGLGIALLLAAVGLSFYLNSNGFRDRVRRYVISELEAVTGGRVELRSFVWNFSRLQFDIDDLTIHGLEKPGDIPYVHADHARVMVKIISLFRRDLGLRELDVQHPVLHVIVYPDGSTNQPTPKTKTTGGTVAEHLFSIRMDRLRVSEGMLLLNETQVPIDISANTVTAGMTYQRVPKPSYNGWIQAGSLQLKHLGYPEVVSQAATNFTLSNNEIQVSSLQWTSGKSKIEASARIVDLRRPRVETKYRGTLEVAQISKIFGVRELRDGMVEVNGSGRYISNENFFTSGRLALKDGEYSAPALHLSGVNANSEYALDVDRITLTKLSGQALGGTFDANASLIHWSKIVPTSGFTSGTRKVTHIPPRQPMGTVEIKVAGMPLAQGLRALLAPKSPLNQLRIASSAQGTIATRWVGSLSSADTTVDLNAQAPASPATSDLPLTGSVHATYHGRGDRIDVAGVNLAGRTTRISATGAIGAESELRVSVNTSDLSELANVIRTFGTSQQQLPAIVHGHASFNGTVKGKLVAPTIVGHLQATDFDTVIPSAPLGSSPPGTQATSHSMHWDSLVADISDSPSLVAARNLILKRGSAQITGSASAGLRDGQFQQDSSVEARLAMRNSDLQELQSLAGTHYAVSGSVTGQVAVAGTKQKLNGTGYLQLADGAIYGEPYRSLATDVRFQGQQVEFRNIALQHNGGRATGQAAYAFDSQTFAFSVKGSNFDLAHLSRLQTRKLSVGGRAEFTANGSGTLAQPTVNAAMSVTGLLLSGEPAGDLVATAITHGSDMHLEAHTNTQVASARMEGDIHLRNDFPAELHLDLAKLDFDPLLRAYLAGKVTGHSSLSGRFVLRGPLKRPRDIVVEADIDQFFADVQNIKLHNEGPLRFSVSRQVASIQQMHIVGADTDISGTGTVELTDLKRLDLHGNGHVNLAILQTINPAVSSSGQMTFTVNATGRLDDPKFAGNVQIGNGALAFVDLPNGLSEMNGSLSFDKNRLRVQRLTARTGGGDLVLGGYITYSNGIFFDLTGTGRDIRIRYPEGVSSQATADLRLVGTVQNSLLSGDVTITKFGLTPQFDLAGYVQRAKQPTNPPNPHSLVDNVRLDVHIVSTPELRVETSLARVSGDVDIRLRGTAARPAVLGRLNVAEGDITFNSTTYHLERGDIVFANPVRIEPVVNMEASARVRGYDITLGFHGTPDKLNVNYRSEPPLPSEDIIALLAFGRTRQESEIQAEQGSQLATNQTFAQTASNAILGEALNAAVSSRVQKLFGVSRIKIDPNIGGTEGNPNARLTVEQQISKNVTVTYLTNLGQYAQQVFQVEYNINKNISLVAVRDYTGVLAIDLRIRQRKR